MLFICAMCIHDSFEALNQFRIAGYKTPAQWKVSAVIFKCKWASNAITWWEYGHLLASWTFIHFLHPLYSLLDAEIYPKARRSGGGEIHHGCSQTIRSHSHRQFGLFSWQNCAYFWTCAPREDPHETFRVHPGTCTLDLVVSREQWNRLIHWISWLYRHISFYSLQSFSIHHHGIFSFFYLCYSTSVASLSKTDKLTHTRQQEYHNSGLKFSLCFMGSDITQNVKRFFPQEKYVFRVSGARKWK